MTTRRKAIKSLRRSIRTIRHTLSLAKGLSRIAEIPDPALRKLQAFPLLNEIVHRFGFEIYNQSLSWMNDPEFWSIWSNSPFLHKQRADRKFVAWNLAVSTARLGGETAECGVLDGATSYLVLCVNQFYAPQKEHFMFDSWEGLSEPIEVDKEIPDDAAYRWKKGDLCVDESAAVANLSSFGRKRFLKGWIPERFGEVSDKKFSFVHIDVDLYQPTLDSLEFFYDKVVPGGIILCDDYGSEACPGAKRAFDDVVQFRSNRTVCHLPTGQGFFQK